MANVVSVLVAMTLSVGTIVMPDGSRRVVVNYWKHLNWVIQQEEKAAQNREAAGGAAPQSSPQKFAFDKIQHLKAADLIRAAEEGIIIAERQHEGEPPRVVNAHIEANIAFALEYYPILAKGVADYTALLDIITDSGNMTLRRYLLLRCAPGQAEDSLLARYLQEFAVRESVLFEDTIDKLIRDARKPPPIRSAALSTYLDHLLARYTDALARDKAVVAYCQEAGREPALAVLKEEDFPGVTRRTKYYLALLDKQALVLMEQCRRMRDEPKKVVKNTAKRVLQRVPAEVPFTSKAALAVISPAPAESAAPAG